MPRRVIIAGRSCFQCRRRKIKCDRGYPCSYCVKIESECFYPPGKIPLTSRVNDDVQHRIERIEDRLNSLEQGLEGTSLYIDVCHTAHESVQHSPTRQHSIFTKARAESSQLSPDGSELTQGLLRFQDDAHLNDPSTYTRSFFSIRSLHPPEKIISFLWQRYLEIVDPIVKIFHTPSVQKRIIDVAHDWNTLDWPTEALMFAIYYCTIVSLPHSTCVKYLENEKPALLERYRACLEHCLLRVSFDESCDLSVLQAFVIYLICGRRDPSGPDAYSLIRMVIGLATKAGIHLDGTTQGFSPLETEMRRRLWWQICILDVRLAEDQGRDPCILDTSFTTQLPSNINDLDLHPDMSDIPKSQNGRTEMLLSLVRFKVIFFTRQILFTDQFCLENGYPIRSVPEKCQAINQFQKCLENKYLSFCDKKIPLDYITIASNRLIVAKMKIKVNQAEAEKDRARIQKACLSVLWQAYVLRHYEKGKRWLWLVETYIVWDVVVYVLVYICSKPTDPWCQVAWKAVDEVYQYWENECDIRQDDQWLYIKELRERAQALKEINAVLVYERCE